MNYYKKFINDVFVEWRFQTDTGVPNINNPLHESLLRKILIEKKISNDIIQQVINYVKEDDLVKKKGGAGGTYTVKNYDKSKHDLIKKNASAKDIEKAKKGAPTVDKQKTKPEDVLDSKSFTKMEDGRLGFIEVEIGDKKIPFLFGKNVKKFRDRLYSLVRGGGNQTLANNAETVSGLFDSLETNDIEKASEQIKNLQSNGIKLGFNITSMGGGRAALQVRMGSLPLWTGKSFESTNSNEVNSASELASNLGLTKAVAASDSPDWKPQARLNTNKSSNQQTFRNVLDDVSIDDVAFQVRPDVNESGFMNIGNGQSGRSKFASELKETREQAVESMTPEELKAYDNYITILDNDNSTVEDLEKGFAALVSSSLNRPNEVVKNFGELHVAAMLTHEHPDDIILIPTVGNMSVSDVIRIKKVQNKATGLIEYIVVDVPVKAEGSGVASSAVKVTHALVPTEEGTEQYNKAMTMLMHATNEGPRGPQFLDIEDDQQSQEVIETMREYLQDTDILSAIDTNKDQLEQLIGKPLPQDLSELDPKDMIKVLTRGNPNCKVFSVVLEKFIKPTIDNEATANQLVISEQNALGKVTSQKADPRVMHSSSAKRRGEICTIKLI